MVVPILSIIMSKSEIEYYKKLYGDSYEYMLSVKKSLKERDLLSFSKKLETAKKKQEYWIKRCTSVFKYEDLKYAEYKANEYSNAIDYYEFMLA